MHAVVAAKQVVTYWNNVVKRTGCGEENYDKSQRENNPSVMSLHRCIDSVHILLPARSSGFMNSIVVLRCYCCFISKTCFDWAKHAAFSSF